MRVNRKRVAKTSRRIQHEDVITATVNRRVRILKVLALGERRGPVKEAETLYEDLSPPPEKRTKPDRLAPKPAERDQGAGRPTKRERRKMEAWVSQQLESHGQTGGDARTVDSDD